MCVTSLLCCPWADLWPFYGLYCKRFSLSLYAVRRSHGKDSLYPVFENSNCSPSKQFVVKISKQLLRTFAPTIYLKLFGILIISIKADTNNFSKNAGSN